MASQDLAEQIFPASCAAVVEFDGKSSDSLPTQVGSVVMGFADMSRAHEDSDSSFPGELLAMDDRTFFQHLRVTKHAFQYLLEKVRNDDAPSRVHGKEEIPANERFRCLKHLEVDIGNVTPIIVACCVIHNIARLFPDRLSLAEVFEASDEPPGVECPHENPHQRAAEKRNYICNNLQ
ncbi:hypothetical protein Pmani_009935 [Petrolisthes manimaculis]|uniref:Nuclease HARBI1 n=1 Tax=Petrolisthes manimaculis TaxID=1843537 RepID=A0AAE1Q5F4_9EUCA|nr:hypothetical protein Pmani_009935 [Petrolisthes manimaculis]